MALINGQNLLAFTFGILGNLVSIMVYLAPLPTFYRIYRKKSTEGFHSLPYLMALFSSMLWLYYALLKKDAFLLTTINSFGCVVEIIYIIMYTVYAPRDKRVSTIKILVSMNIVLLSLVALLTHFLEVSVRVKVIGWICVAFSVTVFAAPLAVVAQVIKTRSVEFMPLPLSFFLTLSAVMWLSYGLFIKDICVALPNILGFILGLLQMVVYVVYRKKEKAIVIMDERSIIDKKQLPDHNLSIVILSTLGASEVYPVDDQPNQGEVTEEEPKGQPEKCEKSTEGSDDPPPNDSAV